MTHARASRVISQVCIESLSHEGRGVARIDGKAVFVHDALPGECVDIRITRRHRSHDEADTLCVHQASGERVTPRCEVYGLCGGCSAQHMSSRLQLAFKSAALFDALARVARIEPLEKLEALTGPAWHYRRRARLGVKHVPGKHGVLVGFRERLKYYITDMRDCHVLEAAAAQLLLPLRGLIGELSIRARLPQIELGSGDEGIALVLRVLDPPSQADLVRLRTFADEQRVDLYLQSGGPATVEALSAGTRPLGYRLDGFDVSYEFVPTDFVQINAAVNRVMVDKVVDLLQLVPGQRVLDLFAGLGNFTLPIARQGVSVRAVEGEATLVQRARINAERNGLPLVEVVVGDLFDEDPAPRWLDGQWDRVLLDPPRAGAEQVCRLMGRRGPPRLVYVSCNPATLARDAAILVHDQGYRLEAAGIIDMFPQTSHVEALAVFSR